jgi:hypothetical protein
MDILKFIKIIVAIIVVGGFGYILLENETLKDDNKATHVRIGNLESKISQVANKECSDYSLEGAATGAAAGGYLTCTAAAIAAIVTLGTSTPASIAVCLAGIGGGAAVGDVAGGQIDTCD